MTADDQLSKFTQMDERRQKLDIAKYYLDLQKSEGIAAQIAGQIYAAYIQTNKVNESNVEAMIQKSVNEACQIAEYTDKLVRDKEENSSR